MVATSTIRQSENPGPRASWGWVQGTQTQETARDWVEVRRRAAAAAGGGAPTPKKKPKRVIITTTRQLT